MIKMTKLQMTELNEMELKVVANNYKMTMEELNTEIQDGNFELFSNMDSYVSWQLEDMDRETLIQMVLDGDDYTTLIDNRVFTLEDESIVFNYQ